MNWHTSRYRIDLTLPKVMGIVNITPDSFSDGGRHADTASALAHCERLIHEGADILDLGAESTRPGSRPVALDEEWARLLPVLRVVTTFGCPISIDTSKGEVMRRALAEGADIVNDIHGLRLPGAFEAVRSHPTCGVCLMHMRGTPDAMQRLPVYDDVVAEVHDFLSQQGNRLIDAGFAPERIVYDPGIGFGKSVDHNFELLRRQEELLSLKRPLLVGWSRKSSLKALTGHDTDSLMAASVAAALAAVQRGACVVRVHDVAATVDGLKVWRAAGLLTR